MGRPKLERTVLQARVHPDTPDKLKQMALDLGFQWGADGNTGKLLDAIAHLSPVHIKSLIQQSDPNLEKPKAGESQQSYNSASGRSILRHAGKLSGDDLPACPCRLCNSR